MSFLIFRQLYPLESSEWAVRYPSMGFEDEASDSLGVGVKVMLASAFALFAIVLLVIIFHFYIRSRLRNEQRRRHELVFQITTQISPIDVSSVELSPNSGLDPVVIDSLPKLLYKNSEQFRQGEVMECSVCLGAIMEDTTIRVLPNCKHLFHVDCVDTWFGSNTTCPICRTGAEPMVQTGHGHLGTRVQPTAPEVETM